MGPINYVGNGYTVIVGGTGMRAKAHAVARGTYQRSVIDGIEALSGATLKGKAAKYGGRYQHSRDMLILRLKRAGIPVGEMTGKHNKRVLVIGSPAEHSTYDSGSFLRLPELKHGKRTLIPNVLVKLAFLSDPSRKRALIFMGADKLGLIDFDEQTYRVAKVFAFWDDIVTKFIANKRRKSIPLPPDWMRSFAELMLTGAA